MKKRLWHASGKYIVAYLVYSVVVTIFVLHQPNLFQAFVSDSGYRANHFNVMSVAAILAGFMFTTLGILVSISDKEIVKKLSQSSIIDKKQGRITNGMRADIVSVLLSVIFILSIDRALPIFAVYFLVVNEISFLCIGVFFLIRSMMDMTKLLDEIKTEKNISDITIERLKQKREDNKNSKN